MRYNTLQLTYDTILDDALKRLTLDTTEEVRSHVNNLLLAI